MIKLLDLTYYAHTDMSTAQQVIKKHAVANGYARHLHQKLDLLFVKHAAFEGFDDHDGILRHFFRSRNKFWHIPFKSHRFIRSAKPDIVLVQGLVFPLQTLILRMMLPRRTKMVVQHHAELPASGIKGLIQKWAFRSVDAFMFTDHGNANKWISRAILPGYAKIYEVLEASTGIRGLGKTASRSKLNLPGGPIFLWVARLNQTKDPLTVLTAFEQYLQEQPGARLYIIHQTDDLLPKVLARLTASIQLARAVKLIGKVPNEQLAAWFSAADFYLSGSHNEGSGYALIEAMACGCVPIVTDIPSFRKITGNGQYGLLYPPGNSNALLNQLRKSSQINIEERSAAARAYFTENLTDKVIADAMYQMCVELVPNKATTSHAV